VGEQASVPPPLDISGKQSGPKMTMRLSTLVKQITNLREAGLKACHCIEEFHLRHIRPLGHREKLAYECPQLADPSRDLAGGKVFSFTF
jgi:hypothetical protein